jgi:hemolysin activation/secretion protein
VKTVAAALGLTLTVLAPAWVWAQPAPERRSEAPAGRSESPAGEARVSIARFRVTGSSVFTAAELEALLADAVGQELSLTEINALARRITAHYRFAGYILARAYVPAQEVRDGVLEIAVLEGRVGRVQFQGFRHHDPEVVRPYFQLGEGAGVFHGPRHERGLLLINDLPGLRVRSTLTPGEQIGTTDIVVEAERDRFVTASLEANNYGSRFTGRERFGGSVEVNNLIGVGDGLSLRGMMSRRPEDLWFARGSYSLPLGTAGTRTALTYTHVESRAGEEFRDLDIQGAGDLIGLSIVHPFVRGRALNVYGQLGFDYKDFDITILGDRLSRDRLRVLTLSGSADVVDRWRGLTGVTLGVQQGLGGFMDGLRREDDPEASRAGAGGTFTKLVTEITRLQQIVGPTSLYLRMSGQWASTRLVTPEQFAIGGAGTVRGYPIAEVSGDHGYASTAELRWNAPGFSTRPAFRGHTWGDLLQVFAFVDHGGVFLIDPGPGEERLRQLTGAGVGLRFGLPDSFLLKLEFAKPVTRPVDGPAPSDGRDNVFYFLIAKFF